MLCRQEIARGVGERIDKDVQPADRHADGGSVEHDIARHGVAIILQAIARVF